MADEPISGLTETTSVTGNEFIPIVQSGVTKKIKQINLVPNQSSFSGTILFDSDITLSSGYIYLEKNTNSGSRSLTIPSATGNTGKFIFVAKQYNNGYNIACSGGGISCTLTRSNDSVLYICDGSSWQPHLNISNELLLAISGKEPTITAGTTSQYWRGDKTWQTFPTISTPSLNEVTDVGNTTTNDITVGGLVVNMPSGSGVATSITKGGAGEALTVNKTSGSGNVASFTGGTTSFTDIEVTSSTASTPAFFSTVKGIISATGALLGTWFQTLTADTNPVDADTIIVNDSTASFEAKKTTLLQLWTNYILGKVQSLGYLTGSGLTTNYLPYWDGTKFVNSLLYDNGTTLGYNNTTNNSRILTSASVNIADIVLAATTTQFRFFNYGLSTQYGSITATSSVLSINSTTQLNLFAFSNTVEVQCKATETLMRNELFTFTRQTSNSATVFARLNNNGFALGSATINARSQLHLQSTSKGFLPNVLTTAQRDAVSWVAGDAGMIIYNSTTNKHQGWNGTTWNDMY